MNSKINKYFSVKSVIVLTVFLLFSAMALYILFSPKLVEMLKDTTNELNSIPKIPQSTFVDDYKAKKTSYVRVSYEYKSQADYEEIKEYYINELKGLGWDFNGETFYKDEKLIELNFTKNSYELTVSYNEDQTEKDYWDYSLSLLLEK